MATPRAVISSVGRRKRSAFARGSRLSPGWGIVPRRPVHSIHFSFNSIHLPLPWFPKRQSPRPLVARTGRSGSRSLLKLGLATRLRAAPGTSRAAVCSTILRKTITIFRPNARVRAIQPQLHAAADGERTHLAPHAMGAIAQRGSARPGRGRMGGELKSGHRSQVIRFVVGCRRRCRKTKIAPPMSLLSGAMRGSRLPSRHERRG